MKYVFTLILASLNFLFGQSQCMVNYLDALSTIEGKCIFYKEIVIGGSNGQIRFTINKGMKYDIYLLNANRPIAHYKLMDLNNNALFDLKLEAQTKKQHRYSISASETMEASLFIRYQYEENNKPGTPCVLFALFISEDDKKEMMKHAKSKNNAPDGMVKVDDNLFFDKVEICNKDWKEYEYWNKRTYGDNSKEYQLTLRDTVVWNRPSYNEPWAIMYHRHPAYDNYPVVSVSYEQAIAFCNWRSRMVNEAIYYQNHKDVSWPDELPDDIPKIYRFRLPTKEEWEKVASIGLSEKHRKKLENSGCENANLHHETVQDGYLWTGNVESYYPNELGIYNLIGNVAEMTNKKGLAKGGSWQHTESESTPKNDIKYTKPTSWLGFRCVCEKTTN